ncbi:MAG: alpha/beta hydrolase [Methylobacteriaceae bacterium]|nr:alpha/beta hydrolase [Methylobacteriaceae bacterium]
MKLLIDGREVFAAGRLAGEGRRLIVFLHGAGMDHSVFAMQSRWFASRGFDVAALDWPGHGRSQGPPLASIAALADWTAMAIAACGAARAVLVGHSMGALAALDCAARHGDRVEALALLGAAARMPVHPDMLASAARNGEEAIAMVSLWGLGAPGVQGGAPAPGQWMLGAIRRLIEASPRGALHASLAACDSYGDATPAARQVACPTLVLSGERDLMTPAKGGRALAAAIAGARFETIPGAGHMMMIERDGETLAALRRFVGV